MNLKIFSATVGLLSLGVTTIGCANTLSSLSRTELQQVVVNNTLTSVAIDNLNGKTINNTFAMYMDEQGKIYGKMSIKPAGEPQFDEGTYQVNDDGTFYITWKHWDEQKRICGRLFATANAYISIDCDNVFHTVFMADKIQSGNHITKGNN